MRRTEMTEVFELDETLREGYEAWLEEQADRAEYERMVEM
jgi:hypothetical protein